MRRHSSGDAADQAWGEHEVGYPTGTVSSPRSRPLNSSGSRPALGRGGVEQSEDELLGRTVVAVPGQAGGHDRRVVGPHRAAVVADGVVAAVVARQGAQSPAGEHRGPDQGLGHLVGLVLVDDARPQAVPDVGGQGIDRLLVGVESDGEPALLLQPEVPVEVGLEVGGLGPEAVVGGGVAGLEGEVGAGQVRAVGVRLHLGEGDRRLGHPAVAVADAVPAVLPALIGQAPVGRPVVLDVAVAVGVAEVLDPLDGPCRVRAAARPPARGRLPSAASRRAASRTAAWRRRCRSRCSRRRARARRRRRSASRAGCGPAPPRGGGRPRCPGTGPASGARPGPGRDRPAGPSRRSGASPGRTPS